MAWLRFLHQSPLLSLQHKPQNQSSFNSVTNVSSTFSLPPFSPLANTLRWKATKFDSFILHFSATTQEPALKVKEQQQQQEEEEEFSKTRLIAQNVPWTCTTEDIRSLFEKYGTVVDVEISMHNKTRNRGLAFVSMASPEEALAALNNLESYELEGRSLRLNYAKSKKKKLAAPEKAKPVPAFNLFVQILHMKQELNILKSFSVLRVLTLFLLKLYFMIIRESHLGMALSHSNPRKRLMQQCLLSKERCLWKDQFGCNVVDNS